MINEERSYTEYNVEVPTTDFPIGFDILDDGIDEVAVTLNDVDPTTLGYTVIQVNNTTYRFAPAVPSGVVRLTRITDIDQMAHVFTEGAIFISENMDGNFKQIRHAQQEVRDYSVATRNTVTTTLGNYESRIEGVEATTAATTTRLNTEITDLKQADILESTARKQADTLETQYRVQGDLDSRRYAEDLLAMGNIWDGISTRSVWDSELGLNQQQINDLTGAPHRVKAGGYNIGERVVLENGDIVKSTVASNSNDPNVAMTGWVTPNLVIYPEVFGAIAGEKDSSDALNAAILFCSSNNYVLDGRGRTYNGNSLVLKDNTHIKRISINSNLYDTMNSVITTDYGMITPLKNITLDTVYIDGKRELHTNVTSQMDGGRCAILIRRPIDGLTIRNCKLNNAVTDGLSLFPVDWGVTESDWFHFVKNITIENTDLQWNGRWGGCADSVKHMTLQNVHAKFNGLDVGGGGAYTTGKSARLDNGKRYGGGFDLEEYNGFAHSKDVNIINCDMTENAGTGLWFTRTGVIVGTTEITITGGNYDSGTSADSNGKSIGVSLYSDTGAITAYKITISQPNLNGGDLYLRKCQYADVSQLLNLNVIHIDQSVVIADKVYKFVYDQISNSNFSSGIRIGSDDFLGTNNAESTVWLHTENRGSAYSNLKIRAGGMNLGGIRFQKAQPEGGTGVNVEFMHGENPRLVITQYGTIQPADTLGASLGLQNKRFQKAWLGGANMSELGVFASNSAAISGGLVAGDFYRMSTGQVMVVF